MEQAASRTEATAVNYYFSSPTKNISIPVCAWTPRNRLVIVLLCALGLPVGGIVQIILLLLLSVSKGAGLKESLL